jgi:hypothetical protein
MPQEQMRMPAATGQKITQSSAFINVSSFLVTSRTIFVS